MRAHPPFTVEDALPPALEADFLALTFPSLQLVATEAPDWLGAAVARWAGLAVGLALFVRPGAEGRARLLSLMVRPAFRRRGVARALLARVRAHLDVASARWVEATYSSALPHARAFEALLDAEGWSPPETVALRASGRAGAVVDWMDRMEYPALMARLRAYSVLPVEAATAAHWAEMDRLAAEERLAGTMPARRELAQGADPAQSLILLRAGQPVGWMMGHPTGPRGLTYFAAYTRPDLQRRGGLHMIFWHSYRRHRDRSGYDAPWWMRTTPDTPGMAELVRRRFPEFSDQLDSQRRRVLRLDGDARPAG